MPSAAVVAVAAAILGAAALRLGARYEQLARSRDLPSTRTGAFSLDCSVPGQLISPLIYGVAATEPVGDLGATARRWGGNAMTRFNWKINAHNTGKDWFFRNVDTGPTGFRGVLDENRAQGIKTALTIPTLGWVAKDTSSYSFPVATFGPQQAVAPENADIGNGVTRGGKNIQPGPPELTSVKSDARSIAEWVREIRRGDGDRGRRVEAYILDNEPMLWHINHRDVHPEPVTYDELLEKTIAYGSAIRKEDPEAKISGPAEWGWTSYHYSAKDVVAGTFLRPDRRSHGDQPLIPWYLRKTREFQEKTGIDILDILDVHFYPAGTDIGIMKDGKTDPATAALRIRSTRSLWDPTYKDESWVADRMRVIPLLKEWIAANHPGLGISIGEWNFGAETHMSGGLATAEALGRFGVEGLTSAYYWTVPARHSPAYWAFRAYRNFDGKGGRFLDRAVPVSGSATLASLFASRDADSRRVVAVLLNHSALVPLAATVTLSGCGTVTAARGYSYTGGEAGFTPFTSLSAEGRTVKLTTPPYSMTIVAVSSAAE